MNIKEKAAMTKDLFERELSNDAYFDGEMNMERTDLGYKDMGTHMMYLGFLMGAAMIQEKG